MAELVTTVEAADTVQQPLDGPVVGQSSNEPDTVPYPPSLLPAPAQLNPQPVPTPVLVNTPRTKRPHKDMADSNTDSDTDSMLLLNLCHQVHKYRRESRQQHREILQAIRDLQARMA